MSRPFFPGGTLAWYPFEFSGTLTAVAEGGKIKATAIEPGTLPGEFTILPTTPGEIAAAALPAGSFWTRGSRRHY